MTSEAETILRSYIQESFAVAADRMPGGDESLLVSGVLDSMSVLDLVAFLEQRFGIAVADEDVVPENFETIDALAGFVRGKLEAMPAAAV